MLWVRADTTDVLTSYNELVELLALPECAARKQDIIVRAVQTWLRTHIDTLLIFDNADTPDVLLPFLLAALAGHVLLTTRSADLRDLGLGLDDPLALPTLTPEESTRLLLQRARMLAQATPEDHAQVLTLSRELGGLPLALDQAGAYMRKSCLSLADYHQRYQRYRARLLTERHSREYPASVTTTWDISFQTLKASHPAAADLLRFCAFLAPDAIPEELITAGAGYLGPLLAPVAADPLSLDSAIMALRAYSLSSAIPSTH